MMFLACSVVQFHCYSSRHGNAVRTIGVCICRLGYGYYYYHLIWFRGLSYVGYALTLDPHFFRLTIFVVRKSWLVSSYLILGYGRIRTSVERPLGLWLLRSLVSCFVWNYLLLGRPIYVQVFVQTHVVRSVCLVTLYGDSLNSLLPQHSSNFYKAWGLVL